MLNYCLGMTITFGTSLNFPCEILTVTAWLTTCGHFVFVTYPFVMKLERKDVAMRGLRCMGLKGGH